MKISIHALLAESDTIHRQFPCQNRDFYPRSPCGERLAGPSGPAFLFNFYPRSPCGERHFSSLWCILWLYISIHALLAESDVCVHWFSLISLVFLSTLSLRRATDVIAEMTEAQSISIHALLAESDHPRFSGTAPHIYFYPRSPCGERPEAKRTTDIKPPFLSTLSLRRATRYSLRRSASYRHFYPRSPCGERPLQS